MLDITHRIKKIQLQNDIITDSNGEIRFPRFEKKEATMSDGSLDQASHRFESLSRVISEIEKSRKAVICDMEKLGIDTSNLDFHCQVKAVVEGDITGVDSDFDSESDSDSDEIEQRNELLDHIENEPDVEIQEDINSLSGMPLLL